MKIDVNMLIEWDDFQVDEAGRTFQLIERVIEISTDGEKIVTMNIKGNTGFPIARLREDIRRAYDNGNLRILKYDPYLKIEKPEDEIPANHREIRDAAWTLVQAVLKEAGEGIYLDSVRGKAVRKIALEKGCREKAIYIYLRKYWQRGAVKNSMLPDYFRCGSKGKRRLAESESAPKLGRPKNSTKATGIRRGIRITEHIEKLFSKGFKRFKLTREARTLADAFNKTLFAYFNTGYETNIDGVVVPVMPDPADLPSIDQFRYWYKKFQKDPKKEEIAQYGETSFALNSRELTGDSTSLATSPGAIFMIDATIADVYLVSSFDRKRIIGKPIVYLIADVFSRMIVGFSVSLEGPSWLGASLALDNMVTDKVGICKEAGHTIGAEEWNCTNLPEAIFADRGEFLGYAADVLVNVFGIRIHNTPPYRGDLKGIIERAFGIANEKFIRFVPGATYNRQHGEKSHALDAKLTLLGFRKLLIAHILEHNAAAQMSTYRPSELMIAGNVPLSPIEVWNWGIQNRSGHLRTMPRDIVRLNLLPRMEATVYLQGIHLYEDVYYLRPSEIPFGTQKVEIAYDPSCLDVIYIPSRDGKNAIVSPLTPACKNYRKKTFEELEDYFAIKKQIAEKGGGFVLQTGALTDARQKLIISQETELTDEAWAEAEPQSNSARLKGVRQNRKDEQKKERKSNSFNPVNAEIPLSPPTEPEMQIPSSLPEIKSSVEEEYTPKPSNRSLLSKVIKDKQKEND